MAGGHEYTRRAEARGVPLMCVSTSPHYSIPVISLH